MPTGGSALVMQRLVVSFGGTAGGLGRGRGVVLIPDPVDKTMVHHVSNQGVTAISSNVLSVVDQKLQNILPNHETAV